MIAPGAQVVLFLWLMTSGAPAPADDAGPLVFELTFDSAVRAEPFTGRVLIFLSEKRFGVPGRAFDFLDPEPFLSTDVRDWKPDTPLRIREARGYPRPLSELRPNTYRIRAVMHTNPDHPHSGNAPGNLYSRTIRRPLDPAASGVVKLKLDRCVKAPAKRWMPAGGRLTEHRSRLLSEFHGRDIMMRAIVILPEGYDDDPLRRYPVIYVIPGFGGDHYEAAAYAMFLGASKVPFVRVGLDPTTAWGHHVFADSEVNGPCGRALVEEFIPYLEGAFRLISEPRARFLTGHSSGGWSSLWLQVSHPKFFGGTWSTAPDPVDFRSFCGIDLYSGEANAFRDARGKERAIMRQGGRVVRHLRDFVKMEDTLGPGGQLGSFEAVFGPRAKDGSPRPLFDRTTGAVDHEVVRAWGRYDIRMKVEREWAKTGSDLEGKLTIIVGAEDNFFLEEAVGRLKVVLDRLESGARVEIVPGKDHVTLLLSEPVRGIIGEMGARFLASEPSAGQRRTGAVGPSGDQQQVDGILQESHYGVEESCAVGAVYDAVVE